MSGRTRKIIQCHPGELTKREREAEEETEVIKQETNFLRFLRENVELYYAECCASTLEFVVRL